MLDPTGNMSIASRMKRRSLRSSRLNVHNVGLATSTIPNVEGVSRVQRDKLLQTTEENAASASWYGLLAEWESASKEQVLVMQI